MILTLNPIIKIVEPQYIHCTLFEGYMAEKIHLPILRDAGVVVFNSGHELDEIIGKEIKEWDIFFQKRNGKGKIIAEIIKKNWIEVDSIIAKLDKSEFPLKVYEKIFIEISKKLPLATSSSKFRKKYAEYR